MNILFIFHSAIIPSHGGVERVTSLLGREFTNRGHNVLYLSTGAEEPLDGHPNPSHQMFYEINWNDPAESLSVYHKLLTDNNIDIIINQQSTNASLFLLKHTPENIGKVTCCHVQPFPYGGKERIVKLKTYPTDLPRKVFKWFSVLFPLFFRLRSYANESRTLKAAASVSDKFVLLSDRFKSRVMKYCPDFPEKKLAAVNNPNTFDIGSETSWEKKENLVLFVGRLDDPQKNIKGFIDVWKHFSSNNPGWRAAIVGDGPKRNMYEAYAENKGVRNLAFEGLQANVSEYFKRAKFVCLTSLFEGWGMVLTEGMSFGCIPVCFDSYESARDIIDDGENGIIASSFSATDMADRMTNMANDRFTLETMSINAIEKVKLFDLGLIANKWEDLFTTIKK